MSYEEKKQQKLDERYLRMARIWSENSHCKRLQVGALIVKNNMIISDGYNGTPSGFENTCSHNSSDGATLYVTASPCLECAKLIIQAGIKRVVFEEKYRLDDGLKLLSKANIELIHLHQDEK